MTDRICSVDECDRTTHRQSEWCKRHYNRWVRHGDPNAAVRIVGDDEARFWAKVDKNGPLPAADTLAAGLGRCWLWTQPLNGDGYGHFHLNGREVPAHCASFVLFVGSIPNGLEIDHLCRLRHCVNPKHLEAVPHRENVQRGGNTVKAHCIHGHPYDESNTRVDRLGYRYCKACARVATRKYRTKRRQPLSS